MTDYKEKYEQAISRAKEILSRATETIRAMTDMGGVAKVDDILHIFPELSESEDERIKSCVEMCLTDATEQRFEEFNTTLKDCLAWLEKQGEKNFVESKATCYHNDGLYYAIDILEKTLGKVEGYQSDDGKMEHQAAIETVKALYHKKPAEWNEEDIRNIQDIDSILFYNKQLTEETCTRLRNFLESLKDRVQPHPQQDWNEEDDKFIKELCNLLASISNNGYVGNYYVPDLVNKLQSFKTKTNTRQESSDENNVWIDRACMLLDELNHLNTLTLAKIPHNVDEIISHIKSLKDRVQTQPKQEWSEEDERRFEYCKRLVYASDKYSIEDREETVDWLKSLKPQKHWKPSEEQMKEYSYWYRNFIGSGLASPSSKAVTVLGELLEQLKSL